MTERQQMSAKTPEKYRNKYPIYIPTKGRYESMYTMRALENLEVPYICLVEPQEVELYKKELKARDYKWYHILELPFSNHGKGSGPARNFAWEHSKAHGFRRHWVMDDNIFEFWRFFNNSRIKFDTGSFFRAWEDWNDRFLNLKMSGLQYKFFVMDSYHYKPVLLNSRLMSCILIENDLEHRWRGKWNEDVDLSIRTLKSGYCTALSYTFLCGKARTGTIKGGNTSEVYEDYKNASPNVEDDPAYKKSKMLVDLHPDCVQLVKRYGRWHHHVDISRFSTNKLIIDPNVTWSPEPDEYGLKLAVDYNSDDQSYTKSFRANELGMKNPRFMDFDKELI